MIRIVGTLAVALALVGVAGALADSPNGEAPRRFIHPDYVGKGRFDRNMKVQLKVYERHGREHVLFQATNVRFLCNNRTELVRRDMRRPAAQMPVKRSGRFHRLYWGSSHGEEMYWFKGRLSKDRKEAKGFVRVAVIPPQAEQDAGVPDCTTLGPRSWVAKRVKGHGRVDALH